MASARRNAEWKLSPSRILRARVLGDNRRYALQHEIAGVVPVAVIDALEVVDVQHPQRNVAPARAFARKGFLDPAPVEHASEFVQQGQAPQAT